MNLLFQSSQAFLQLVIQSLGERIGLHLPSILLQYQSCLLQLTLDLKFGRLRMFLLLTNEAGESRHAPTSESQTLVGRMQSLWSFLFPVIFITTKPISLSPFSQV